MVAAARTEMRRGRYSLHPIGFRTMVTAIFVSPCALQTRSLCVRKRFLGSQRKTNSYPPTSVKKSLHCLSSIHVGVVYAPMPCARGAQAPCWTTDATELPSSSIARQAAACGLTQNSGNVYSPRKSADITTIAVCSGVFRWLSRFRMSLTRCKCRSPPCRAL